MAWCNAHDGKIQSLTRSQNDSFMLRSQRFIANVANAKAHYYKRMSIVTLLCCCR